MFGDEHSDRNAAASGSLAAFRAAGAADTWLAAADRRLRVKPDDAMIQFYAGVTRQDLKRLAKAEVHLSDATRLAPGDPGVREAYAWNAVLRFDAAAALERTKDAGFAGAEAMRAEQVARSGAAPATPPLIFGVLGLALTSLTAWLVARRR